MLSLSLKISCYKFHHAIFRAHCHQYSCYILLIWLFDLVVVIMSTVCLFLLYASKILWFSSIFMELVLSSLDSCIFELSCLTVQFQYNWLIRRYVKYCVVVQFFIELVPLSLDSCILSTLLCHSSVSVLLINTQVCKILCCCPSFNFWLMHFMNSPL